MVYVQYLLNVTFDLYGYNFPDPSVVYIMLFSSQSTGMIGMKLGMTHKCDYTGQVQSTILQDLLRCT